MKARVGDAVIGAMLSWPEVPVDTLVLAGGGLAVKRERAERLWEWTSEPCDGPVQVLAFEVPHDAGPAELHRLREIAETHNEVQMLPGLAWGGFFAVLDGHVYDWSLGRDREAGRLRFAQIMHEVGYRAGRGARRATYLLHTAKKAGNPP